MLVYDYNNFLEGDILKKVDRATMYFSIEGRGTVIRPPNFLNLWPKLILNIKYQRT